jgi:hypothetical protein
MTDDTTPPHGDELPEGRVPVKLPTLDTAPDDLAHAPEVPAHRFSAFYECGQYAYARGLEVNPIHLPTALDAMRRSNWHLVAIFGQTDSQHIGFIFRRQEENQDLDPMMQTLLSRLGDIHGECDRLRGRIDDLLCANNDLVEKNRELRRELGPKVEPRYCLSTMSIDGGSTSERVECTGRYTADGTITGGCGEPCSFVMDRAGG